MTCNSTREPEQQQFSASCLLLPVSHAKVQESASKWWIHPWVLQTTNKLLIDVPHFIGQAQDFKRQFHEGLASKAYKTSKSGELKAWQKKAWQRNLGSLAFLLHRKSKKNNPQKKRKQSGVAKTHLGYSHKSVAQRYQKKSEAVPMQLTSKIQHFKLPQRSLASCKNP